jgi:hypothetical protein
MAPLGQPGTAASGLPAVLAKNRWPVKKLQFHRNPAVTRAA